MQLSSSYVLWDVWPTDFQRAPLRAGESVLLAPANTVRPYSVVRTSRIPGATVSSFLLCFNGRSSKRQSKRGGIGRSVGSVSLANASGSRCERRRRRGRPHCGHAACPQPQASSYSADFGPPSVRPRSSGGHRLQGRRDVLALLATDACESFVCSPSLSIRDLMAERTWARAEAVITH